MSKFITTPVAPAESPARRINFDSYRLDSRGKSSNKLSSTLSIILEPMKASDEGPPVDSDRSARASAEPVQESLEQ